MAKSERKAALVYPILPLWVVAEFFQNVEIGVDHDFLVVAAGDVLAAGGAHLRLLVRVQSEKDLAGGCQLSGILRRYQETGFPFDDHVAAARCIRRDDRPPDCAGFE